MLVTMILWFGSFKNVSINKHFYLRIVSKTAVIGYVWNLKATKFQVFQKYIRHCKSSNTVCNNISAPYDIWPFYLF